MNDKEDGKIKNVLKALGHRVRRDIIRTIDDNNAPLSYSYLFKTLDISASSNIAYHLKILLDANLIEKTERGDYRLTQEGKQSTLLFESAGDSFLSKITAIGQRFGTLNTPYILLASWWFSIVALGVGIFLNSLIMGIFFIILGVLLIFLVTYRIGSIISYIFIQSFSWIFFLKKYRILVFIINITSALSFIFIFGTVRIANDILVPSPFKEIIGLVILTISIFCTLLFIALSYKKSET